MQSIKMSATKKWSFYNFWVRHTVKAARVPPIFSNIFLILLNNYEGTSLLSAASSKSFEMVKLLLDNGADKTIKTSRNIVELVENLKLNEILELIK